MGTMRHPALRRKRPLGLLRFIRMTRVAAVRDLQQCHCWV